MGALETIRCFWCKRTLWKRGDGAPPNCTCWGYGRHRFHAKFIGQRLRRRVAVAIDPSLS